MINGREKDKYGRASEAGEKGRKGVTEGGLLHPPPL
jgi:hypothetical protein